MDRFCKLPPGVLDALEERGVQLQRLLYCVRADLDAQGFYLDSYLTFDDQTLYFISGYERSVRKRRGRREENVFVTDTYEEYPLQEIEELESDRQVNLSRLVITLRGKTPRELCRFSIGCSAQMELFKDRVLKTGRHEPIDDSLLADFDIYCPKCGKRYPNVERKVCPFCANKSTTLMRMLKVYMEYKKQALFIFLCIVLSTIFTMLAPYFSSKVFYDEVLTAGGRYYGQVLAIVLAVAAVKLIGSLFSMLYGVVISRVAPKIAYDLRSRIFTSMQHLSVHFFTSKQTGSLMARVNDDVDRIYGFFVDMLPYFVVSLLQLIGLLIVMATINLPLTLVVFAALLLVTYGIDQYITRQRKFHRKHHIFTRSLNSTVSDSLNGQRVVKAFAKEEHEIGRFSLKNRNLFTVSKRIDDRNGTFFPAIESVYRLTEVLTIGLGAWLCLQGNLTLGGLITFVSYLGMTYSSMDFFMGLGNRFARCIDAASRMFEILDAQPTVREREDPVHLECMRGDISLKGVKFEYEPGRPVIKDISFDIEGGKMLGIVGKTGSGKTTMINLISRLYDVTEGRITIDGVDIRDIAFEDLRRNIGIVSQETYLFRATVADNIRYAKPDASMEEVIRAATSAYAHDFIMRLNDGYDTIVGTGGVSLSGGEKQRISIARAILQSPRILILDEATAAMDTQTERRIQEAIEKLREGRTIIAIAHRLSTLRDADRLCVVEDGRVVESGTHAELIAKRGAYFNLHKIQTEMFQFIAGD